MTIIIDLSSGDEELTNKAFRAIDRWANEMARHNEKTLGELKEISDLDL